MKNNIIKRKDRVFDYLFLHFTILIFTGTTICSKLASSCTFLSLGYIMSFVGIIFSLGTFALLWQQVIKRFEPSVAYSNKSVTTIWVLLFSCLIFNEGITINNIIGTVILIVGVILVSKKDE